MKLGKKSSATFKHVTMLLKYKAMDPTTPFATCYIRERMR